MKWNTSDEGMEVYAHLVDSAARLGEPAKEDEAGRTGIACGCGRAYVAFHVHADPRKFLWFAGCRGCHRGRILVAVEPMGRLAAGDVLTVSGCA